MSFWVPRHALGLAALLSLAACREPGPLVISPLYAPSTKINFGVVRNTGAQLTLAITDQRPTPNAVGRSTEDRLTSIEASPPDVVNFVGAAFWQELTAAGYSLTASGSVLINVTILELWVEEANTYQGSTRLRVDIVKNGALATSLTVTGAAKRWGATLAPEIYNQILSDCLLNAIQDLVKSNDFQTAVAPVPGS
ncbi:MAG TPA: hypothetical protein VHB79_02520 [Polyangiaceae bacterium]|nr:hypothetical protein [Polyangiaceae bacterium]